jgi:hypothetical protein
MSKKARLEKLEQRAGVTEGLKFVVVLNDGTIPEGADTEKAETTVRINLNQDDI